MYRLKNPYFVLVLLVNIIHGSGWPLIATTNRIYYASLTNNVAGTMAIQTRQQKPRSLSTWRASWHAALNFNR